ncbi:ABC transporter ATP-binding protein/permease [Shewanella submarina]|uniref:ABCB family ABC transporter ATP-binding protein/permease n=1 Tax=Shewanella submarina TaxID=2016376 RepID=A0ABV7GAW4_9GAMM|nr:ABC transporter ATP-binding protein/permease [Shewanella submarina]MCL1037125.1 ABC transporter ATP-binding protein/permease [Shewanella submarina]
MRPSRYLDNAPADRLHWQVLRLLWPYLLEYRLRVGLAILCLLAAKLAGVTMPFVLKDLVNTLDSEKLQAVAVPIALVLAYGGLRFLSTIIGEVRDTLFGRVTERAIRRLGLNVFRHLHSLDLGFHLDRQTGGLSRDIERGSSGVSFLMRFMVFNIVPTVLEIGLVVGIFWYNYGWVFAAVTLVAVAAYGVFSVIATEWRTGYVREAAIADSTSNTRAIDSLLNYETVKYFNNEEYEFKQYDEALGRWEKAKRDNRLSLFALNAGQAFIIASAMTVMMGLAASDVISGDMTIGDFVLVNAFMMQLFMPLNFLGFVYREIRGALANIERLFSLLDERPQILDTDTPQSSAGKGHLVFDNVSFAYGERQILDNVSFELMPGEKIAIVGESGGGKSTIIKLLFRFYDVTGGSIKLDGVDIRQMEQQSLRRQFGIVPQDTVLFNDTLLENIRYGRPEASDEDIRRTVQLAHLEELVKRLPKGLETRVGERGMKLSGGEKQRVSIARAILKGAPVMVFDEATSSLDSGAEQAILTAMKEVSARRTSLVVAHRLSTVVDADRILVLKGGQIVEQGKHQQLLAVGGVYAGLWQMQHQSRERE